MAKRSNRTTISLIRDLQTRSISGRQLSPKQRQVCVERLYLEGMHKSEIAELMGMSDKTIYRDIKHIRTQNALHLSNGLPAEILGEYRTCVDAAVLRLNRLVRDQLASVPDKINAVRATAEIYGQFIERLSVLGFMSSETVPSSEQVNFAELVHIAGVVSSEFSDDSMLAIEIRSLIARMQPRDTPPTSVEGS